jgi:hypothetical protein
MNIPKKRCRHCHGWFEPYPPQKYIQEFCSRKRCQQARHRQACQAFRRANPDHDDGRRNKIRNWARQEDYWSHWRQENPEYREQEKARMRNKRKEAKAVAKRDAWKQISVDELKEIQGQTSQTVAKRDAWDPRMDELLVWLIKKETSQNETHAQVGMVNTQ